MCAFKKIAGLVAGVSCVGVLGVAIAQGVPPDARIPNHPIAAGQQSPHITPMGETGVPAWTGENQRTALLIRENREAVVAQSPEPVAQPAPVAEAPQSQPVEQVAAAPQPAPEPAPAPMASAPETTSMGAGPAPEQPAPRADRG